MNNILNELSILTTIQEKQLTKLFDKLIYCINDDVCESLLNDEEVAEIDIYIGKLIIKKLDDRISYKFIPSEKLENSIKETVLNKKNLLIDTLETKTINKITDVYKDFI